MFEADVDILDDRLRGNLSFNESLFYQMTFTFNPVSASHWLKGKYFDQVHEDIFTHQSTYLENRFIDEAYHKRMLMRKERDPDGYRIYGLGEWGESGGLILTNYRIEDFDTSPERFDYMLNAQDFGFNHVNAIGEIGFKDGELFLCRELYVFEKDTSDILQKDALFLEYSDKVTHDVLSAFRLPPVYVGMSSDYNRSTVETAKELTEEQVFQPRREGYEWRLNNLFKGYGFELVEVFLQSPDYSNTEDMKNILEPAIQAGSVAPNDLRALVAKVINSPLEPFDKEDYNYPLKQNGMSSGASINLSKAYGETSDSQLASILRQAIAKEGE